MTTTVAPDAEMVIVMDVVPSPGINEIARRTGTNSAHISRIFSGKRQPSLQLAVRIADVIGMSLSDFWNLLQKRQETAAK